LLEAIVTLERVTNDLQTCLCSFQTLAKHNDKVMPPRALFLKYRQWTARRRQARKEIAERFTGCMLLLRLRNS
jgi:hypothetical protein